MSECYDIVCDKCRVRLGIGQHPGGEPGRFYLWNAAGRATNVDAMGWSPLAEFLMEHVGHPLRVVGEEEDTWSSHLELEAEPGLPVSEWQSDGLEPDEIREMTARYEENRRKL